MCVNSVKWVLLATVWWRPPYSSWLHVSWWAGTVRPFPDWLVFRCPINVLLCIASSMIPTVQHERMKFLVIATKTDVEVYAWAQKPYSKFMQFKVSYCLIKAALSAWFCHEFSVWKYRIIIFYSFVQSFPSLEHKPVLVNMLCDTPSRLNVLYASSVGELLLQWLCWCND